MANASSDLCLSQPPHHSGLREREPKQTRPLATGAAEDGHREVGSLDDGFPQVLAMGIASGGAATTGNFNFTPGTARFFRIEEEL